MYAVWLSAPALAAEPSASATPSAQQEPRPLLGTVQRPLHVRGGVVTEEQLRRAATELDGAFKSLTRDLLELQDAVIGELPSGALRISGMTSRSGRGDLRVQVDLLDRDAALPKVRVRLLDGEGLAVPLETALVLQGQGAGRMVPLAGAGELVLEEIEVGEGVSLQLHLVDGEILVLWLEEGTMNPVLPPSAPEDSLAVPVGGAE